MTKIAFYGAFEVRKTAGAAEDVMIAIRGSGGSKLIWDLHYFYFAHNAATPMAYEIDITTCGNASVIAFPIVTRQNVDAAFNIYWPNNMDMRMEAGNAEYQPLIVNGELRFKLNAFHTGRIAQIFVYAVLSEYNPLEVAIHHAQFDEANFNLNNNNQEFRGIVEE